jgi:hypothetical protein
MQGRSEVVPQFQLSSLWTEVGIAPKRQLGNGEQVAGISVAEG